MIKQDKIIYIIGKGSIGIRHSNILKKLGYNVVFIRRKVHDNNNEITLTQINKERILFFLICNPTSLHQKILKKIIIFNKPILVEKPLFDKPNSNFLRKIKNKNLIFTTFQMRFDPRIIKLKKLIKNKKNLISFIEWKTYLPNWHANENYKKSYASQKKLGGGAILTLSHEIDLAIYLFGKIKRLKVFKIKNDLDINVEDKVLILFSHENGAITSLFLNFASKKLNRNIKIFSNKNSYEWDFYKKYLIYNKKFKKIKINFNFNNDKIYEYQLEDFLKKLRLKKLSNSKIHFKKTYYTQKILDKIKSMFIKIKNFY